MKTCERQSLRASYKLASFPIEIAPARASARIEENADDSEIEFGAGAGFSIRPIPNSGKVGPAVVTVHDEMPPARMKRHLERRIGLARRLQYQIDYAVHAIEMHTEVCKPVVKPHRQHAM